MQPNLKSLGTDTIVTFIQRAQFEESWDTIVTFIQRAQWQFEESWDTIVKDKQTNQTGLYFPFRFPVVKVELVLYLCVPFWLNKKCIHLN